MIITKEAQTRLILRHMEAGNSITDATARELFDCSRVGARIWDIEHQMGIPVSREWEYRLDNNGKVVKKWMRYYLARQ